jgi:hypothetical protein
MTDFIAYIAPPGEVVEPPVHPATVVDTLYSDGETYANHSAGRINWSSEGDGPRVVAYRVVEEYTPPKVPREVVAWAVVVDDVTHFCRAHATAESVAINYGGTVVKLVGQLP